METIYKHNISEEEIRTLSRMIPGRKISDRLLYETSASNDLRNADLFRLYLIRKNREKARNYFEKIEDDTLKYLLNPD